MKKVLPGFASFFPFWEELTPKQQEELQEHNQSRYFEKGDVITPYQEQCLGLMLIQIGQLRAFILSDSGKEVTLFRLYELDICLFSASCIMSNIQFDIQMEVEKDITALVVPVSLYDKLMNQSIAMNNYTNQLMASRFTDVIWTLEQVLFKSMDCRLAQLLISYAKNEDSVALTITHEIIARDLGSAREVVSRLLKYFRREGLIELSRGHIYLLDKERLQVIADG